MSEAGQPAAPSFSVLPPSPGLWGTSRRGKRQTVLAAQRPTIQRAVPKLRTPDLDWNHVEPACQLLSRVTLPAVKTFSAMSEGPACLID